MMRCTGTAIHICTELDVMNELKIDAKSVPTYLGGELEADSYHSGVCMPCCWRTSSHRQWREEGEGLSRVPMVMDAGGSPAGGTAIPDSRRGRLTLAVAC